MSNKNKGNKTGDLSLDEKKRKKENLVHNLKIAGGVIAGAASAGMAIGLKNDVFGNNADDSDSLILEEKRETARAEGGPYGTFEHDGVTYHNLSDEEFKALSSEQKQELYETVAGANTNESGLDTDNFTPQVYEKAPMANGITDEMKFNEAFKTAREEVGAGGVFEWHGQLYNTYFAEEFNQMTPDEKSSYVASIDLQVVAPDVADAEYGGDLMPDELDVDDEIPTGTAIDETSTQQTDNSEIPTGVVSDNGQIDFDGDGVMDGSMLSQEDSNNDGNPDVAYIDANNDGNADMKVMDTNQDGNPDEVQIDQDGDGTFDSKIIDSDGDGTPDALTSL